jgi:uncharacterized protein YegL
MQIMSIQLQSNVRYLWYGTKKTNTDSAVIVTTLKVDDDYPLIDEAKHILFTVDVSGSMGSSIANLKATLLAVKDYLLSKGLFGKSIFITIVTYSDTAKKIWSHFNSDGEVIGDEASYIIAVKGIKAEGMTNMDDGLTVSSEWIDTLASTGNPSLPSTKMPTWILVLTDGDNNRGARTTAEQIGGYVKSLLEKNPLLTIECFGYGQNFNVTVLQAIGNYTQIKTDNEIPEVFGSVMSEVVNTMGFRAKIVTDLSNIPDVDFQTPIKAILPVGFGRRPGPNPAPFHGQSPDIGKHVTFAPKDPKQLTYLYGNQDVSNLYRSKEYTCAIGLNFNPWDHPEMIEGKKVSVQFIGFYSGQWYELESTSVLTVPKDATTFDFTEGLTYLREQKSKFTDLIASNINKTDKLKKLNEALAKVTTDWIGKLDDFPEVVRSSVDTATIDLYSAIRLETIDLLKDAIKVGGDVGKERRNEYAQMATDTMTQRSHTNQALMTADRSTSSQEVAATYGNYMQLNTTNYPPHVPTLKPDNRQVGATQHNLLQTPFVNNNTTTTVSTDLQRGPPPAYNSNDTNML